MADPFAKYAEQPQDDPFAKYVEEPKPDTGVLGWVKGKVAENEARRQEMLKHPIKSLLTTAANVPIIQTPAAIYRGVTGNAAPEWLANTTGGEPTAGSVVKGVVDMPIKVAQLGQHGYDFATGGNGQNLAADRAANYVDSIYRDPTVIQSKMGEAIGQSLPFVLSGGGSAAPQALSTASKVRQALALLKGSATGAGVAVASTPDVGVQSNEDFAKRQIVPAVAGATLGAVVPGVAGAIESKLSRNLTPEAQAIQDLGDRFGVRTLVPDLASNRPGLAKSAVLAESIPGSGMVNQRVAQQAEAKAAAQKLLEQHGIEGEVPSAIQGGLQSNLASVKGRVRAAYDKVGQLADGLGEVPLDKTLAEIQKMKAQEAAAVVPDQGLIGLLDKMESRLALPEVDKTYTGVRGLRSDLGSMVSDYYKGTNATTGSKGVQVLQGIKKAVEDDLGAFTSKNGAEVERAAREADSLYKRELIPLKDKVITTATKNSEPDQIYKAIVAAGPDRAQKFYSALTPDGQAAVRSQMVKDAYEQATKVDGVFSPAKFAQSLEKIKDSTGVFFKGQDKFELDGFTNLMRHIQRAGQVNENPPTGQRILMGLMGGEAIHGVGSLLGHGPEAAAAAFGSMAAGSAGAKALTKLFSSKAGKSLLLGASEMAPGSPAFNKLIERDLPRVLGVSAASAPNVTTLRPSLPAAASTESNSPVAENK